MPGGHPPHSPIGPWAEHVPESSDPKPLPLSHIECASADQDYDQEHELLKRYGRDVVRHSLVLKSDGEARPGTFAVGRLVLSLPASDPRAPWGKLPNERLLFNRVHRVVHVFVQSQIVGHGYEVCRLRPECPTHDNKEEKCIQSRFLELINADDYQVAEREFYKYMRRGLRSRKWLLH